MVVTDPRTVERRRAKEATIRVIDMVVYLFAMASGVFALTVPPNTIREQLAGFEWLGTGWGIMLLIAGLLGFIGRLTRLWIIEVPGTAAAIFGELVYVFILLVTAFGSATAWVAVCMITGATLALLRRYVELQIFTSDPEAKSLGQRFEAAMRRRTENTAGMHR